MPFRLRALLILGLSVGTASVGAAGETKRAPPSSPAVAVCDLVEQAAARHALPFRFFARLIWQESRFKPSAESSAGAQGIAQFMPATAADEGLADPFAVHDALERSAALLDRLRGTFGNLGLAAAAYNAGAGRVTRWREHQGDMPAETRAYVEIVTGHSIEDWNEPTPSALDEDGDFSCPRMILTPPTAQPIAGAIRSKPWAVILVGSPRRDAALREYGIVRGAHTAILRGVTPSVVFKRIGGLEVPRFIVQIERETRTEANDLCSRLQRAGGSCFVLANR